ncbi:MAG: hypothetical protein CVT83_02740 [Alphaproteobacteria bacterium HGW-Alphaproteobacteria-5]|nr:MAG: hypothetical protein CVT83_02740 [Alphaproteobacteria bacterium HGW-Alphaproteobacteria-5]
MTALPPLCPDNVRYLRVWPCADDRVMSDAASMWEREGALPDGASLQERGRELVIALYDGTAMIGCLTAELAVLPRLQARFAFCRSFIAPPYRRMRLTDRLMIDGHDELGNWARGHPEERLAGCAAIYQNPLLGARPVEPSGLTLIGYTKSSQQIRVLWFNHYELNRQ